MIIVIKMFDLSTKLVVTILSCKNELPKLLNHNSIIVLNYQKSKAKLVQIPLFNLFYLN